MRGATARAEPTPAYHAIELIIICLQVSENYRNARTGASERRKELQSKLAEMKLSKTEGGQVAAAERE